MGLTLGEILFTDFEVPASITFGGDQTVALHRLQSGARVIDTLGPNDADIRWSGVISGADAGLRAQMLDQLRITGTAASLTWDTFYFTVIITELHFSFNNSWWIPYKIRCIVADDPSIETSTSAISVLAAVTADLVSASAYTDASAALAAVNVAGAAGAGNAAYATASTAITALYQRTSASLQSFNSFSGADVAALAASAGAIAALAVARGYIGRAAINYTQTG
jgi:hypothetical protein